MQTGDHGFDQITSALLRQKQIWERLQGENHELRQQLIDLRAGRGISIEIQNQRFELTWEPSRICSEAVEVTQGKRSQTAKAARASSQPPSGALEEMPLDESSSAMKNSIDGESQLVGTLNEEQKAALRRELSGSYLLE
jgi:hypothetical protein